jgi:dihydropteroate synthase
MKSKAESNYFLPKYTLNINGRLLDFSTPKIMGILNVTPDSFYDGNFYRTDSEIANQVDKMIAEGADIIDVGGYSTRPGAQEVALEEERSRTITAIRIIKKQHSSAIISIDTFKGAVARAAIDEGASIINDVSGGELDPSMISTVLETKVPYVVMHMKGTPQTMTSQSDYSNVTLEVIASLREKVFMLERAGHHDIIVDPGFGFAKNISQNFILLNRLELFKRLGRPVMVGISRKSMIWKTLKTTADQALNGTTVLNTIAVLKGASILRVHDVRQALEAVELVRNLKFEMGNAG